MGAAKGEVKRVGLADDLRGFPRGQCGAGVADHRWRAVQAQEFEAHDRTLINIELEHGCAACADGFVQQAVVVPINCAAAKGRADRGVVCTGHGGEGFGHCAGQECRTPCGGNGYRRGSRQLNVKAHFDITRAKQRLRRAQVGADQVTVYCGDVERDVEDWLASLAKKRIASEVKERKGFHFSVLKNSWLVGFSDQALLVMGPVVADAQAQLQQQMVKYLKAEEEDGITVSPMYERLQTITSPMAMVAQAQALPEKFVAPFTLGTPKDTDPSQVVIAAEMDVKDGILQVKGETFSFNKEIDEALKKAAQTYRPIKGSYVKSMPADALAGIFMNVKGEQFLPMMQSNRSRQTLLMGINQAIDMDNIIRSVDGDMAIVLPSLTDNNMQMTMAAKLSHAKWLGDVDYWKTSCPAGAKIANWGKNAYFYTDGKTSFYFGVTDDKQFFSGSDQLMAQYAVKPSNHPIDAKIQKLIVGQKLAMVINLAKSSDGNGSGKDDAISTVTGLLSPVFGNLTSVVYTLN